MKRFWSFLFLAMLAVASVCHASSCAPPPPAPASDFAYAETSFSASVRGTFTPDGGAPHPVAAVVTVGAPGEEGARDMTLSFTQPPALAGVTVAVSQTPPDGSGHTAHSGGRTVTFTAASPHGTVTSTAEGGELDGFFRFGEALLPCGDVAEVSPVGEDGTHTVTCRAAEGDREAVFLFSREGGLPLRVRVRTERETIDLTVTEDGLAP